MSSLFIAVPAYGEAFYGSCVQSLMGLQNLIDRKGWDSTFATLSWPDISEARNYLLTSWIDRTKASHFLFVDADTGFDPELVWRMIELDKPVVGAIYPKRKLDLRRFAAATATGMAPERAAAQSYDYVIRPLKDAGASPHQGFIEVEGAGTGLMLIRRDCVDTMLEKLPEIDQPIGSGTPFRATVKRLIRAFDILHVDGSRLSCDYSFCHRWRQCGGEIWASTDSPITHVGPFHFRARFADARRPARVAPGKVPLRAMRPRGPNGAGAKPPKQD